MMKKFHGFLFSKLANIGYKLEGPQYGLQQFDKSELVVAKKTALWQADPKLQEKLATKVTITGELVGEEIQYSSIEPYIQK